MVKILGYLKEKQSGGLQLQLMPMLQMQTERPMRIGGIAPKLLDPCDGQTAGLKEGAALSILKQVMNIYNYKKFKLEGLSLCKIELKIEPCYRG
jgi:hypothetical protein